MSAAGKKAVCFYFQVHQPFRLKRYRFFDIGHDHYYYDDYTNESILRKVAEKCYLPANRILLDLLDRHKGKFRVSFCLSGIVINQFRLYAPEVLDSFRQLAATGMVEFLAETNAHSLASLKNRTQFVEQVEIHRQMIREHIGTEPVSFRNTELIYSDQIGSWVADMGFKAMLTEGAKHILGWKSPNFLYCNSINPRLKVLMRNFVLSDDIAFRFSNKSWSAWPLTADKYASWMAKVAPKSELLNIFLDYETFGEHNWKETGIFDFLEHMPAAVLKKTPFRFMTPSEIADTLQPVAAISVPSPVSWADEERDITAWLGNELQAAALEKLYELSDKVKKCNDHQLSRDFEYLQSSDHFYYMATKFFSDGAVHAYFNPYDTPYDAFMNYMNVLSDFELQLNKSISMTDDEARIFKLEAAVAEKERIIEEMKLEMTGLSGGKTRKTGSGRSKAKTEPTLTEIARKIIGKETQKAKTAKSAKTVVKKAGTVTASKTRGKSGSASGKPGGTKSSGVKVKTAKQAAEKKTRTRSAAKETKAEKPAKRAASAKTKNKTAKK